MERYPYELICEIGSYLTNSSDLVSLLRTNKRYYRALQPILFRNDALYHNSSVLFWSAKYGSLDVMRMAIMWGADVNTKAHGCFKSLLDDMDDVGMLAGFKDQAIYPGQTTLIKAAWFNRSDMVALLLDRGANIHHLDHAGENALDAVHGIWTRSPKWVVTAPGEPDDCFRLLFRHGAQAYEEIRQIR